MFVADEKLPRLCIVQFVYILLVDACIAYWFVYLPAAFLRCNNVENFKRKLDCLFKERGYE